MVYSFLLKQIWSEVSNLKFTRKEFGKVHIEMRFVRGDHKHSDGLGGLAGLANYPRAGGDIFFDDEENWSLDSYNSFFNAKTNLLIVATHELGHALGLDHSNKATALMAPGGNLWRLGEVKLDIDDVQAIQALYGAPGLPRPQDGRIEVDIEIGNAR